MNSTVYKAIRDKIKADLPWLQYVDMQKGQFEKPSQGHPVPIPCVLVGSSPVKWESHTETLQEGQPVVSIFLYLDNTGNSFEGSEQEEQSLAMLDKEEEIFQSLQGLSGVGFQPLTRVNSGIYRITNQWICQKVDFQTAILAKKV